MIPHNNLLTLYSVIPINKYFKIQFLPHRKRQWAFESITWLVLLHEIHKYTVYKIQNL